MSDLDVVILAAGKGTRMNSDIPKVMHSLAGRPMLAHVIATARLLSAHRIVVVYGHGGEAVKDHFNANDIEFVCQEPQLGTGHAVQQALPVLDANKTLVLYGDVPLIGAATLQRLLATEADLALLTMELSDPGGYGRILRDRNKKITSIVEEKDATARQRTIREVNTGLLAADTAGLKRWLTDIRNDNAQGEFYLTDIVAGAVREKVDVATASPDNEFEVLGINSTAQLARMERIFQWDNAQHLMSQGVTLADPARVDVRGTLSCGRDVTIDIGCIFEGNVVLGDHVSLGAHCVIRDSHIGPGSMILPFCHIDGATIGSNCRIGPYARFRPGNHLADDVRVGNFVEVKATQIAEGSKANHLSYLGDSEIGRNVNVGAGTITCNYDGANKHRTIIEDNVFIGSDTQIVAPATIGANSTIGAGSTITKDTPEGELTLSRSKQVTIPGWKRPTKSKPD
ncbi:MAG: bifunctional UDP-N-acetylglucosamine diphosphorylase/glucosamine-1-phosphate N-acetyltransferase GlmU [Betaproteobacteria bacterium]|jgi:bifunctional UDP-N-acetylglucosamine pyrophosphorylase/glucosamine-1-phosphate N-acetyltransferase|nr:MAG: bifunctional UDP-N-acetylglucosamine diphosphorylase/glucosamine-1-phosphate N-acetyltransferase GlmU [Betaproteobacteria bacterium]